MTHSYFPTKSLLTDFYQFTMAQALFTNRRADCPAVFHIFFRQAPCNGHFALAAGIADALDYIRNFVIDSDSLSYLSNLKNPSGSNLFTPEFIKYLENLKPILDIHGIHDGEIIFAQEPMLRLEGPLALCMLLESPLLNIINYQTLIATKAARIKKAAGEKLVVDFGLRRAFGFDGAISATKAAYLGGLDATSNLWASNYFNIPHAGSQAHSFIMSYDSQEKAFESFAQAFPDTCILLTDTYDSDTGLNDAIKILKTLKPSVQGIRLDSGDLLTLSQKARFKLDKAGLSHCVIIASGDLDELSIEKLVSANAPIDIFGVGTKLVSAHNDRALGGVCKLASIFDQENWRDTYKLSNDSYKRTFSGRQAVKRYSYEKRYVFDYLYNPDKNNIFDTTQHSNFDDEKLITKFLMRRGDMLMASLTLEEAKIYAQNNLLCLEPHLLELCPYSAQNNYKIVVDGTLKALYLGSLMKALLLIDLQNDFMPGGPLAVPEAHSCVEIANKAQRYFNIIIASKDWHPAEHLSFACAHEFKKPGDNILLEGLQQTLWPKHCVQHTRGAALVHMLEQSKIRHVVTKGTDKMLDSYSAFFDNAHRHETGLHSYLQLSKIEEIYILGVALEYCVKFSALDAIKLGYKTYVIVDGCRGLGLQDINFTLSEMSMQGVNLITLADLENR